MTAIASLISMRLSLPPWSVETEGRWTAYELQKWGYFAGELPLSLGLLLAGILLWPPRPHSLVTKGQGTSPLLFIALAVLACGVYTGLTIGLSPLWRDVLLGGVVNFVPRLATTILGAGVARRRLPISQSTKKPYEAA